jgi:hypothetical protein
VEKVQAYVYLAVGWREAGGRPEGGQREAGGGPKGGLRGLEGGRREAGGRPEGGRREARGRGKMKVALCLPSPQYFGISPPR